MTLHPPSRGVTGRSTRSGFEWFNLRELTGHGCTCTPKLLDVAFLDQSENDPVPGGFIFFIVMERLPGRNLVNFASLPMSERDQVRLAFAKSIQQVLRSLASFLFSSPCGPGTNIHYC